MHFDIAGSEFSKARIYRTDKWTWWGFTIMITFRSHVFFNSRYVVISVWLESIEASLYDDKHVSKHED